MDARLADYEPNPVEMNDAVLFAMRGVNAQAFRLFGNRVLTGPFKGMIIPERAPWSDGNAGTKLLGTYEHELHDKIEYALRRTKVVINVGCAEGYYAVGLARRGKMVYGYDISDDSLKVCQEYVAVNGVGERVSLAHGCQSPEQLSIGPEGHRLYIVDCEGAETVLLDPEGCPELIKSDIIVECHEFLQAGTTAILGERFAATHRVELVLPRIPNLNQFEFIQECPSIMSVMIAVEKRPMPCYWLACWTKQERN